jgi:hypothetical protein
MTSQPELVSVEIDAVKRVRRARVGFRFVILRKTVTIRGR